MDKSATVRIYSEAPQLQGAKPRRLPMSRVASERAISVVNKSSIVLGTSEVPKTGIGRLHQGSDGVNGG